MNLNYFFKIKYLVAPYTGAWIEIAGTVTRICTRSVAPYTGAWIEIYINRRDVISFLVAPYTGAWIEIGVFARDPDALMSHPTRVRGLKSKPSLY